MTPLQRIRALPPIVRIPALEVLDELTRPITPRVLDRTFQEAGFSRADARRMTLALKRLQVVALVPK